MDRLPLELQLTIYERCLNDDIWQNTDEDDTPDIRDLLVGSRTLVNICKASKALNFVAHGILKKHVCAFYDLLSHVLAFAAKNGDYDVFLKFQHFLQIPDEWEPENGAYYKAFTAVDEDHTLDELITSTREGLIGVSNATSVFNREVLVDLMQLPMSEEKLEQNQGEITSLFCNLFSCPYITSDDFSSFFSIACEAAKLEPAVLLERFTKVDDKGENEYWKAPKNTILRSMTGIEFLVQEHSTADLTALLSNAIANGQEDAAKRLMELPENCKVTANMIKLALEHPSTLRLIVTSSSDITIALEEALVAPTVSALQNVLSLISTFPGDTSFTLTPEFTTSTWSPLLYANQTNRYLPRKREDKAHALFASGFWPPMVDPKNYLATYFDPGPGTQWIMIEHIFSGCRYSLDLLRPEEFVIGAISSRPPNDPDVLSLCNAYKAPVTFNLLSKSLSLSDQCTDARARDRVATAKVLLEKIGHNAPSPDEAVKVLIQTMDWMQGPTRGLAEADFIMTRMLVEKVWEVANGAVEMREEGQTEYETWWKEKGKAVVEIFNMSAMIDGGELLEENAWRGKVDGQEKDVEAEANGEAEGDSQDVVMGEGPEAAEAAVEA